MVFVFVADMFEAETAWVFHTTRRAVPKARNRESVSFTAVLKFFAIPFSKGLWLNFLWFLIGGAAPGGQLSGSRGEGSMGSKRWGKQGIPAGNSDPFGRGRGES